MLYSHSSEDIKGRNPRSSSVVDFENFRQKVRANKKNLLTLFFLGLPKQSLPTVETENNLFRQIHFILNLTTFSQLLNIWCEYFQNTFNFTLKTLLIFKKLYTIKSQGLSLLAFAESEKPLVLAFLLLLLLAPDISRVSKQKTQAQAFVTQLTTD